MPAKSSSAILFEKIVRWELGGVEPFPAPHRRDEGIAALEFAIIAPVFLMILLGIIIYGIFFATWIAATEAASEGARASVAGLSTAERVSFATTAVSNILSPYKTLISCQLSPAPQQVSGGAAFEVSVTCSFSQWGFTKFSNLVPFPTTVPPVSIIVSNGG